MYIFSFVMKIKIEGNRKMKLIVYLLDMICYKMQLIEVPKLVSVRLKKTERKNLSRWTDNFSIHCKFGISSIRIFSIISGNYLIKIQLHGMHHLQRS